MPCYAMLCYDMRRRPCLEQTADDPPIVEYLPHDHLPTLVRDARAADCADHFGAAPARGEARIA